MGIPLLDSIKSVERQYSTGEAPVLVACSDKSAYICKYMRSSLAAYKLACEWVRSDYLACINRSRKVLSPIIDAMPKDWNVAPDIVERKIGQLLETEWIEDVWQNFIVCLNENIGKWVV